jgi:hypothetical protein
MCTRVKRPLDEPLLSPRDTDKRAGAFGGDGVVELQRGSSLVLRHFSENKIGKGKQNYSPRTS